MASEDDKRQFQETQKKYVECKSLLKQAHAQHKQKNTEKNRCELTLQELDGMPDDTRTFKALGKAFVLEDKSSLQEELKEGVSEASKEAEKYKNQAEYLEKRAGEYESSLRELLQGNEALQKEFMGMSE